MQKGTGRRLLIGTLLLGGLAVWSLPMLEAVGNQSGKATFKRMHRQPVAMLLTQDGKWLFVANRRSGTISVIDTIAFRNVAELAVGRRLADLAATPDGNHILTVDEEAGELIVLRRQGPNLLPGHRLKVSPSPLSVRISRDGSQCTVASLWPRQLTTVTLGATPRIVKTLDLPFAPRCQLLVSDSKLVVTEAFGGRLALIDLKRGAIQSVRSLPGHNIRGLALSADGRRLLVAHQTLNPLGRAVLDDIHWGNLLTNDVRTLRLSAILDAKADLLLGSDLLHLGDAGHGTGDPASVAVCGHELTVALAGIDQVAVGPEQGDAWQYIAVGRRPTALVPGSDGRLYVANTFSDYISVVDLKLRVQIAEISLGPYAELKPSERGEMLFYDSRLSHDGWLSCHSCHTDGHSNGKLADTLSDGTYGTPKRILSLRGVGETPPWTWTGSMAKLETQVQKSIETTMHGMKPTSEQVRDLTAYLRTLPPPPPLLSASAAGEGIRRGQAVFAKHACANCHTPPLYTSAKTYDVGLVDEAGHKDFNPPSLRGISQGGPYFHDGRARTLADVFSRYRHQLKGELGKQELDDLLTFLDTL